MSPPKMHPCPARHDPTWPSGPRDGRGTALILTMSDVDRNTVFDMSTVGNPLLRTRVQNTALQRCGVDLVQIEVGAQVALRLRRLLAQVGRRVLLHLVRLAASVDLRMT